MTGPRPPKPEAPVMIEMIVRLSNGHYEASVKIPMDDPPEEKDRKVGEWWDMQLRYLGVHRQGDSLEVRR